MGDLASHAEHAKVVAFDRDVTVICRISARKAAKSLARTESALQKSLDTIGQFRNWESNLKSICSQKIYRLQAQSAFKQRTVTPVFALKPDLANSKKQMKESQRLPTISEPPRLRPSQTRKQQATS